MMRAERKGFATLRVIVTVHAQSRDHFNSSSTTVFSDQLKIYVDESLCLAEPSICARSILMTTNSQLSLNANRYIFLLFIYVFFFVCLDHPNRSIMQLLKMIRKLYQFRIVTFYEARIRLVLRQLLYVRVNRFHKLELRFVWCFYLFK